MNIEEGPVKRGGGSDISKILDRWLCTLFVATRDGPASNKKIKKNKIKIKKKKIKKKINK